jgi:hypothetical protein
LDEVKTAMGINYFRWIKKEGYSSDIVSLFFYCMPYRKPRVYSGLNAKVSLDTVSTLTSVVKPKVCILNRTTGLPVDIYNTKLLCNYVRSYFGFNRFYFVFHARTKSA